MTDGGPLRCREPATGTVQIDDEHVRVVRWDFNPGAETGWHRHGFAYVVVPVTDGALLLEEPGGATRTAALTTQPHHLPATPTAPFPFRLPLARLSPRIGYAGPCGEAQPGQAFTSVSTKESGAGPALTTLCSTPAARA